LGLLVFCTWQKGAKVIKIHLNRIAMNGPPVMSSDFTRRGRPRGSGLDDRVQLRRISALLEADPALKPTTAIKAIGVSDPSTIRRLRDKLKADLSGAPVPVAAPSSAARGRTAELFEARGRGAPARQGRTPADAVAGGLAIPADPAPRDQDQVSWFAHWFAFGLLAVSSTVEAQLAVMDDFLRVPQVTSALRHQLLVNEVAKAFCPKRTDVRSTLH
jgi:hypothetical protein